MMSQRRRDADDDDDKRNDGELRPLTMAFTRRRRLVLMKRSRRTKLNPTEVSDCEEMHRRPLERETTNDHDWETTAT
ncbi:unnamed protein product [Linum trigynum]|uniref:Uncharacterized protein n=1 Tax=Linum trigynum TaxID=586398 RepID=A0AAV2GCS2_9ROSI